MEDAAPLVSNLTTAALIPVRISSLKLVFTHIFKGSFGYKATVNDVTNSSPQFASPPAVYLMKGCGGQEYAVAPVDPEGDTVRCRWSLSSEVSDMAWSSMLTQFSLDQDTCVVTYHPENDKATTGGSKAISVQVEDFDAAGNLL